MSYKEDSRQAIKLHQQIFKLIFGFCFDNTACRLHLVKLVDLRVWGLTIEKFGELDFLKLNQRVISAVVSSTEYRIFPIAGKC